MGIHRRLKGQAYFEIGKPWLKWADGSEEQTIVLEQDQKGIVQMVQEFGDSIMECREPLTSGDVGIKALTVVLKAYESMEQGVSLSIP